MFSYSCARRKHPTCVFKRRKGGWDVENTHTDVRAALRVAPSHPKPCGRAGAMPTVQVFRRDEASLSGRLCRCVLMVFSSTRDRKSTRLNSSHLVISYAVFCLKKKSLPSSTTTSFQTRSFKSRTQLL